MREGPFGAIPHGNVACAPAAGGTVAVAYAGHKCTSSPESALCAGSKRAALLPVSSLVDASGVKSVKVASRCDRRANSSSSISSINALSRNRTDYHRVIKQPSTCVSTRGWPKWRSFSHEDCVVMLAGEARDGGKRRAAWEASLRSRWVRIFLITTGSSMQAIILTWPPQLLQISMSM